MNVLFFLSCKCALYILKDSIYPLCCSALAVFLLNLGKVTEDAAFVDVHCRQRSLTKLLINFTTYRWERCPGRVFSQLQPRTLYKNAQSVCNCSICGRRNAVLDGTCGLCSQSLKSSSQRTASVFVFMWPQSSTKLMFHQNRTCHPSGGMTPAFSVRSPLHSLSFRELASAEMCIYCVFVDECEEDMTPTRCIISSSALWICEEDC